MVIGNRDAEEFEVNCWEALVGAWRVDQELRDLGPVVEDVVENVRSK